MLFKNRVTYWFEIGASPPKSLFRRFTLQPFRDLPKTRSSPWPTGAAGALFAALFAQLWVGGKSLFVWPPLLTVGESAGFLCCVVSQLFTKGSSFVWFCCGFYTLES